MTPFSLAGSVTMKVMLGTALLGATAGVIGAFAVLRRRALAGDMVAHAALPGICLVFLLLQTRNLLLLSLGALASGLLGIAAVAIICRWTRTKQDAAIGLVLSSMFGLGIVLLSLVQRHGGGHQAGLDRYLLGETATIQVSDIEILVTLGSVALLVVALFFKEFQSLSFDPEFTAAQGWPVLKLDLLLMGLLVLVTVVGLPICGVILMAALLIAPAAAARYWTNHLGWLLVLAGTFGAAAGIIGTLLASGLAQQVLGFDPIPFGTRGQNLPPGPLIVLSGTALFLLSMAIAPTHGLIAGARREWRLRSRILREHLLRSLFELSESRLPELPVVPVAQLVDYRSWSKWLVDWQLRRAKRQGLVAASVEGIRLTPEGLSAAAEITRAHRLWELYLVVYAGIAADHVDRDADVVEHLLPRNLLEDLEERLQKQGRMPRLPHVVPQSPHAL